MIECKICNETFKSKRSFIYHLKKCHAPLTMEMYYKEYYNKKSNKCLYCNNQTTWSDRKLEYNEVCSNKSCICKLANRNSKKSLIEKYNVSNPGQIESVKEKVKKTKFDRYGSETYNNTTKREKTCIERYGVDNPSKSDEIKLKISEAYHRSNKEDRIEKTKQTNYKKWGVDCTLKNDEIKRKTKITYQQNWNSLHPMKNPQFYITYLNRIATKFNVDYKITNVSQIPDIKEKIKLSFYKKRKEFLLKRFKDLIIDFPTFYTVKIKCPVCNTVSELNINFLLQRDKFNIDFCLTCTPYKSTTHLQAELCNYIKSLGFDIKENSKIPNSKREMDIYIPSKNLAFEFNGIYWHSEIFVNDKKHHLNKKKLGLDANINIINIWEDEWHLNKSLIQSKIKSSLGIYEKIIGARECKIKELNDSKEAKKFLIQNHIQGFASASNYIGLYYNNELVSLISFAFSKNLNGLEIKRFCNKSSYKIQGSFSKLLKYFIKTYKPDIIYTYLDLDWGNGHNNLYEKNGFKFIKQTDPGFFYVVKGKREHREKFQKKKLVKMGYDSNLTATEILSKLGYYKIYNCGNLLYKLEC